MVDDEHNRKRGVHDIVIDEEISNKRAVLSSDSSLASENVAASYMFKILVPSILCGSVIGRGGVIISEASARSGARIKLSQASEFYPTTNDRVLAISGSRESISVAVNEFVARIIEAPENKKMGDLKINEYGNAGSSGRAALAIRVLIPVQASGTILGRGGSIVRQIGEMASCKLHLGDGNDLFATRERIVTISSHTTENTLRGADAVLSQLFTEPDTFVYANTRTSYQTTPSTSIPSNITSQQFAPPLYTTDPGNAYINVPKVSSAMPPLYGSVMPHPQSSYQHHSPAVALEPMPLAMLMQQHPLPSADTRSAMVFAGPLDFTPPVYTLSGDSVVMTMGVPDNILGCLLGHGGKVLKDIMMISGANIQISQKDVFIEGTRHRSVKTNGTVQQVQAARAIIFAKLHEESALQATKNSRSGAIRR